MGLSQLVTQATRVPDVVGHTANCLDHLLTTDLDRCIVTVSSPIGTSDHCLVKSVSTFSPPDCDSRGERRMWRYKSADWDEMRHFFASYPWQQVCFSSEDPSSCADAISDVVRQAMEYYIPYSDVPVGGSAHPWFNADCAEAEKPSTLNSDRNQGNESRAKETISSERSRPSTSNISSSAVNGFSHFVNGHKVDSSPPAAVASSSRYPTTTNVAVRTYSSGTSNSTASLTQSAVHLPAAAHPVSASHPPGIPRPPSVAHSLSVPHPPSAPHPHTVRAAAAAPAAYLPYQPAFPPPPTRGYYPQPYPSTSNPSTLNSDRNQGNESRAKETISSERSRPSTSNISSSAVNGFSHFVNGHKVDSSPPAAVASSSRYPTTTNVAVRTYSSGTSNSTASLTQSAVHLPAAAHPVSASHPPGIPRPPSVAHSLSVPHPPSAPHPHTVRAAAAAPAAYLPYQPAFPPPPTRGYYPQPYPSTSNHVPNIHQSYPNSPRGAVTPQVPARPSTSTTAPPVQNAQMYNPYFAGRYPSQPHNYPPFQ
ncbi:hypothetical protein PYW07_013521 [Mythimna separata]|uniref:Uncharacterized protein n=1 Tax=Mythimna separata TaxID=271217 RepID=A0AAD7YAD8_MYTSE|nr:hypothetical protein PYW07_013521 [Mythimna separata]